MTDPAIQAAQTAIIDYREALAAAWTNYCREIQAAAPDDAIEATDFAAKYFHIGADLIDGLKKHAEKDCAALAEIAPTVKALAIEKELNKHAVHSL